MTDGWIIDIVNSPAYASYTEAEKRDIVTGWQNKRTFVNTFARNAAIGCFRYDVEGLPATAYKRTIKQGHLWYPGVTYFELDDAPGATFALPSVPGGSGFTMNGTPGDMYAFGRNGDVFHIRNDIAGTADASPIVKTQLEKTPGPYRITAEGHGVFVRENYMLWPFINQTIFYSDQIADTMRAMENNRYWLKHPVGLHGTEEERKTWEKYREKVNDNVPYVWLYDTKIGRTSAADHAAPENMNDATDFTRPASEVIDWFEQQYWRECGIQNMGGQIDKKGENLQTAEVTHTDDYTAFVSQILLDTLNENLDELHKLPGCENVRYIPFERGNNGNNISGVSGKSYGSVPGEPAAVPGGSIADNNGR